MLMRIFIIFTCLLILLAPLGSVYAQFSGGEAAESKSESESNTNSKDLVKAQSDALKDRMSGVMKRLDEAELTHFMVMFTNYNMYSVVKAVREDIKNAIDGCSKNNPEMEDELRSKFSNWDTNVGDSMKEVDGNIKAMALAQDYISQNELNMIYGLVDETRAVNSSQFEKTPVTTPEACEFMISKMDETQENMIRILSATMQSYPNMLKKTQK